MITYIKRDHRLYFAYGIDISEAQIREKCEKPVCVDIAKIEGYALSFYGHTAVWDGGCEDFIPAPSHTLWGVVYWLNFSDADRLDTLTDVRLDGTGSYFHYPLTVSSCDGKKSYDVLLYKKDRDFQPESPSTEYRDVILQGALERGFPAAYVRSLQQMISHPASYPVPRQTAFRRSLLLQTACDCGDLRLSHGGPGFHPVI